MVTRWIWIVFAVAAAALGGCTQSSMVLRGQVTKLQQEKVQLAQEYESLKTRAKTLDETNQTLSARVAQYDQQIKVQQTHIAALKEQLSDATGQLAEARQAKQDVEKEYEILTASMRRRSGVSITPNNSFLRTLPASDVPELHVRRDGDVIRIGLPSAKLFEPGSARLKPEAVALVDKVAAELWRTYPEQRMGVEGHTDSGTSGAGSPHGNKQLSVSQAAAVYELLVARTHLQPAQLYVAGHGANQPLVSNGTPAGRERNRRVELVVYPERWR